MAYDKQTWVNGETITQEKLNHMEDGIANAGGGGVLVVNATKTSSSGSTYILDKTWQEIHDAFLSVPVIIHQISDNGDGYLAVTLVGDSRPEDGVMVNAGGSATFIADNPTDYPESFR